MQSKKKQQQVELHLIKRTQLVPGTNEFILCKKSIHRFSENYIEMKVLYHNHKKIGMRSTTLKYAQNLVVNPMIIVEDKCSLWNISADIDNKSYKNYDICVKKGKAESIKMFLSPKPKSWSVQTESGLILLPHGFMGNRTGEKRMIYWKPAFNSASI